MFKIIKFNNLFFIILIIENEEDQEKLKMMPKKSNFIYLDGKANEAVNRSKFFYFNNIISFNY